MWDLNKRTRSSGWSLMQQAAELYRQLGRQDLNLGWINIGGGLPAAYQATLLPFRVTPKPFDSLSTNPLAPCPLA